MTIKTMKSASFKWVSSFCLLALAPAPVRADVPAWQNFLKEMVETNSGTGNLEGLESMRAIVERHFSELGFKATVHTFANGHKVMVLDQPGTPTASVLLMGHLDTVFPKTSAFQKFEIDSDRIRGPGVIDMKGGVALMYEIAKSLTPDERRGLRIVLNDDEETGSLASRDYLKQVANGHLAALIFEPGLSDGSVVISESGVQWWKLTVIGRAAHAGLEPEKGYNACVELGFKLVDISRLTQLDRHLSVNIGVIDGGQKPNIVCDRAEARIDIRYLMDTDLSATLETLRTIGQETHYVNPLLDFRPSFELVQEVAVPALPPTVTKELYELAESSAAQAGLALSGRHAGYTSDGNNIASVGIPVLVGLGPYGDGMHTENEYMAVQSFDERLKLNRALIKNLLSRSTK